MSDAITQSMSPAGHPLHESGYAMDHGLVNGRIRVTSCRDLHLRDHLTSVDAQGEAARPWHVKPPPAPGDRPAGASRPWRGSTGTKEKCCRLAGNPATETIESPMTSASCAAVVRTGPWPTASAAGPSGGTMTPRSARHEMGRKETSQGAAPGGCGDCRSMRSVRRRTPRGRWLLPPRVSNPPHGIRQSGRRKSCRIRASTSGQGTSSSLAGAACGSRETAGAVGVLDWPSSR